MKKERFMLSKNQHVLFDGDKAMTYALTEHGTPVLIVYQIDSVGVGAEVTRELIESGEPVLVMEFTSVESINVLKNCFESLEEFAEEKMSFQHKHQSKFKALKDLLDSYESLQRAFTKKCQELSRYKRGVK